MNHWSCLFNSITAESRCYFLRQKPNLQQYFNVDMNFLEPKLNSFPNDKFKTLPNGKKDNFKFDENGRKFSKQVENTEGKEKTLVTSNFCFSHSVFEILVLHTHKNQGLFGKELMAQFTIRLPLKKSLTHYQPTKF